MKNLLFGLIFFIAVTANAQIIIQGKVLSSKSNLPVISASVYLSNTSIGTSTNNEGDFILNVSNIYTGELIISSIGYQPMSYQLVKEDAGKTFYTFKLDVKENILKNVVILSDAARQSALSIFRDNFLGITAEGTHSRIENLSAVYFTSGKGENSIYAYADTPLIITNNLLGYKIYFELIEFGYNKDNGGAYFIGYNRYEEMGNKKQWIKRRKQNYFGSTMHFYRSLIANDLSANGYSIFEIKRVQKIIDSLKNVKDTIIAVPTEAAKILFTDSITNNYYLKANTQIMVRYNKSIFSRDYLFAKGVTEGLGHTGFTAYIDVLADKVTLDKNGIINNPLKIVYNGFWVYEKMGNQLPFNYHPDF